jgi:lipid II:glycine glycyltransferase (peptidoglycan interpeptide bridge formation enzyme)
MIIGMKLSVQNIPDFRQSHYWKTYLESMGWTVERVDGIQIYIRTLPLGISFIKIQHPLGTIPFKKIDTIAKKYHAVSVIIEPHIFEYKKTLFVRHAYQTTSMHHAPTATRKIDISKPIEIIYSTFSENAKRNIKKAQKNNLKIKMVLGKEDKQNKYFEQFYALQKSLTKMKKFYAPGYEESKKKYAALKSGSFFMFAYSNNTPIAAVWYGFDKNVVTYLQTGITQLGYDKLANYLLVLEGIKVAKKLHCRIFDFESIYDTRYPHESKRWKGYSEFKSRFHGEEVYYPPSWIKLYNPFFKWFYTFSDQFLP